jgi:hypothetical protein
MNYANSCRNGWPESYSSANYKCRQQYTDCYKANQYVKYDGRCDTTKPTTPGTQGSWFDWCFKWISQWMK